jgi:hypothetical protein
LHKERFLPSKKEEKKVMNTYHLKHKALLLRYKTRRSSKNKDKKGAQKEQREGVQGGLK